jgi:hypothetical protein
MKLSKIIGVVGLSLSIATAASLNLDMSKGFENNMWKISFKSGKTYYLTTPIDINFSQLKNLLNKDNQAIYIYRDYQKASLLRTAFGNDNLPFAKVKITKDEVSYEICTAENCANPNSYTDYKDFNSFKEKMDNYTTKIDDVNKQLLYKKYFQGFDKIEKNNFYFIKLENVDLDLEFNLNSLLNNLGNFPNPINGGSSSSTPCLPGQPCSSSSSEASSSSSTPCLPGQPCSSSSSSVNNL